jgi:hypothetical protein
MMKMKHEKIIAIIVVMILLVMGVSIGADQTAQSYQHEGTTYPYVYSSKYHTDPPPSGTAYYHVTGSAGNWNLNYYTWSNGRYQQTSSYHSGNDNVPGSWFRPSDGWGNPTGGVRRVDTDGDGSTNDEQDRFVNYVGGSETNGLVYQGRVYSSDGKTYLGRNYDSQTATYIPQRNSDIRVGANGLVYTDLNGDGIIDINDIDLDGNGEISPSERTTAAVTDSKSDYNHATGRFEVDWGVSGEDRWVGPDGRLYAAASGGTEQGYNFEYYPENNAYSFAIDRGYWRTDPTRMVIGGTTVTYSFGDNEGQPASVTPDGHGGYYVTDGLNADLTYQSGPTPTTGPAPTSTRTSHEGGDLTTVHYVYDHESNTYIGVVNVGGNQVIFISNTARNGPSVASGTNSFSIDSSVTVTDDWFSVQTGGREDTGIVVRGADGNFYYIDSNQDLDDLIAGGARRRQLNEQEMEQIFGTGGINFMESYGVYRFGVTVGEFAETTAGYPGFSMFYDENDITYAFMDTELMRDLMQGGVQEAVGDAVCMTEAQNVAGTNVAGGSGLGAPMAYILAEEYLMPDPNNPDVAQFMYLIELYVYAGENAPSLGCNELDFKLVKNYGDHGSLYTNDITGGDYVWELDEGNTTAFTSDYLLTAVANESRNGKELCIEFTKMDPTHCVDGVGNDMKLCSAIDSVAEDNYDYDCSGWCSLFLSGQGWDWGDASTDTTEGDPVPNSPTTPTGSPIPVPTI